MIRFYKDGKPTWLAFVLVVGVVLLVWWEIGFPTGVTLKFLLLCIVGGLGGGLLFVFGLHKLRQYWGRLPRVRRTLLILLAAAAFLAASFISNHGKPDEASSNVLAVVGVLFALLLIGLYSVISRLLDKLSARFSK